MAVSVPLLLKALSPNRINRQFDCTYPFSGSILSRLGKKIASPLSAPEMMNGIFVNSQNPVHRAAPHSNVRSNGSFFAFARCFAWVIMRRQGLSGCFARLRSYINLAASGFCSRHLRWRFRQYSGSALYAARFAALRACRSFRSRQLPWLLCQSIACFRQQKRSCLPTSKAPQTMHLSSEVTKRLYPQNVLDASLYRSVAA